MPKIGRRYCPECEKRGKCECAPFAFGLFDIVLFLFSSGLWLGIMLARHLLFNPWRCSTCGTRLSF